MTKYIRLEWPDSQSYLDKDGCFVGEEQDVFVPEEFFISGKMLNKA